MSDVIPNNMSRHLLVAAAELRYRAADQPEVAIELNEAALRLEKLADTMGKQSPGLSAKVVDLFWDGESGAGDIGDRPSARN
jgi:hypothetical protein